MSVEEGLREDPCSLLGVGEVFSSLTNVLGSFRISPISSGMIVLELEFLESKEAMRTRYLGHVTGYQPIREQYFLIRSVPTLKVADPGSLTNRASRSDLG